MIEFTPGRGFLYELHPFGALFLAVAMAGAAIVVPGPAGPLLIMGAAVILPILGGARAAIRPALLLSLPFWLFLLTIHWIIRGQPEIGIVLAARLTGIIFAFMAVMIALHPARLVEAMVAAGMPFGAVYVLSATLQAIPRLGAHAKAILEAQQCRGVALEGRLGGRIRALVPLGVPLVLGALTEVDERAVALETRGAGTGIRRTSLDPPVWSNLDRIVVIAGLVLLVTAIAGRLA